MFVKNEINVVLSTAILVFTITEDFVTIVSIPIDLFVDDDVIKIVFENLDEFFITPCLNIEQGL